MPSRATHRVLVLIVVFLCILGCSDGPGGSDDALTDATDAPDVDDGIEIEGPTPPEPPAPPVFTPCPDGWREVEDPDTGIVTCDPWPSGGPEECGPDEAHFPGEPGCVRIGTACPAGDWAEDLPTDREIIYVRAGEPGGGDGTRDAPFGTIADAMAVADPSDVVALSKGTFDEAVILRPAVTLWGACVAETTVTTSTPAYASGTIIVGGLETEVRNLTVSGVRAGIRAFGASRTVLLEDVVIDGASGNGIALLDDAHVSCHSVAVRNTMSNSEGRSGTGLHVSNASLEVTRAVISSNRDIGVYAELENASVVMADVAVLETRGNEAEGVGGDGMGVRSGAEVSVTRGIFEDNLATGIAAGDAGSHVELEDVVVRGTRGQEVDGAYGMGINISVGATARMVRTEVADNLMSGVLVDGGAVVEMTDVAVLDTLPASDDDFGRGLGLQNGASCTLTRALLSGNHEFALFVDLESELSMTDVLVFETEVRQVDGLMGIGLAVAGGSRVDAARCTIETSSEAGIAAYHPDTLVVISDVAVRDGRGNATDGHHGCGLVASGGARIEVTRGLFERNREMGVVAFEEGSVIVLAEATISETLERACAVDTCAGQSGGTGLGVFGGAYLEATGFLITSSVLCGIQLGYGETTGGGVAALGGTADLHDGEISHNAVGANVQTEGFDVERLMDGVLYVGNGTNLDMSELPVPELGLDP